MNMIVIGLALIGAVIVESLCPVCSFLGQAKPPVLMSVVIYYALNRSVALTLMAAVFGGLLGDSMGALPLGYSSLCFVIVGLLVRTYRDVVFRGRWVTHMVFGALTGIGATLALVLLLWLTDGGFREVAGSWVVMKVLGVGAFGVIMVPIVFRVMERLDRMVGNTAGRESE